MWPRATERMYVQLMSKVQRLYPSTMKARSVKSKILIFLVEYEAQEEGLPTVSKVVCTDKTLLFAHFTKDGKFFVTATGKEAHIFETETYSIVKTISTEGYINKAFIMSSDKIAIINNKNKLEIYEGDNKTSDIKLSEEGLCLDFTADFSTAVIGANRTKMFVVDIESQKVIHEETVGNKVTAILIANNQKLMAFGTGPGVVGFFDLEEKKVLSDTLKYHTNFVTTLAFTEDDTKCISGAYEDTMYVWNAEDFSRASKVTEVHRVSINQIVLASDGKVYTVGNDAFLKCWNGVLA